MDKISRPHPGEIVMIAEDERKYHKSLGIIYRARIFQIALVFFLWEVLYVLSRGQARLYRPTFSNRR